MSTEYTYRVAIAVEANDKVAAEQKFAQLSGNPADADGSLSVALSADGGDTITHYGANTQARPSTVDRLDDVKAAFDGSDYLVLEEGIGTPDHTVKSTWSDFLDHAGLVQYVDKSEWPEDL